MVRALVFATYFLGHVCGVLAQQDPWTERRGLLTAAGAIAPGFLLHHPVTNIYLSGHLEYFAEDRISFRGRTAWYVDSQQNPALLSRNDQFSAGGFYHFGRGRTDLHLGLEPGIAFVQMATDADVASRPVTVVPTVALGGGITYFVWDHFHFFAGVRYMRSALHGTTSGTLRLDELTLSGGLGFQIRTVKRDHHANRPRMASSSCTRSALRSGWIPSKRASRGTFRLSNSRCWSTKRNSRSG